MRECSCTRRQTCAACKSRKSEARGQRRITSARHDHATAIIESDRRTTPRQSHCTIAWKNDTQITLLKAGLPRPSALSGQSGKKAIGLYNMIPAGIAAASGAEPTPDTRPWSLSPCVVVCRVTTPCVYRRQGVGEAAPGGAGGRRRATRARPVAASVRI